MQARGFRLVGLQVLARSEGPMHRTIGWAALTILCACGQSPSAWAVVRTALTGEMTVEVPGKTFSVAGRGVTIRFPMGCGVSMPSFQSPQLSIGTVFPVVSGVDCNDPEGFAVIVSEPAQ
jgi:hypothetical protein